MPIAAIGVSICSFSSAASAKLLKNASAIRISACRGRSSLQPWSRPHLLPDAEGPQCSAERPAETPKVGMCRVCVKASRAFGPRRLHTNTVNIVFARVVVVVGGERARAPPPKTWVPQTQGPWEKGEGEEHLIG